MSNEMTPKISDFIKIFEIIEDWNKLNTFAEAMIERMNRTLSEIESGGRSSVYMHLFLKEHTRILEAIKQGIPEEIATEIWFKKEVTHLSPEQIKTFREYLE